MKKMKILTIISLTMNLLLGYSSYSIKINNNKTYNQKIEEHTTLKQVIKKWKNYHKEFYGENYSFIINDNLNITDFATKEEAEFIKNQDLETLKRFIERKLGNNINFKIKKIKNITIVVITALKNLKGYNKAEEIIKILKDVQHKALTLPNFNARKFNNDINKIILKLKEYKNLEGK